MRALLLLTFVICSTSLIASDLDDICPIPEATAFGDVKALDRFVQNKLKMSRTGTIREKCWERENHLIKEIYFGKNHAFDPQKSVQRQIVKSLDHTEFYGLRIEPNDTAVIRIYTKDEVITDQKTFQDHIHKLRISDVNRSLLRNLYSDLEQP